MKPLNEEEYYLKLVDWCNKAERCASDIATKAGRKGFQKQTIEAWLERLRKSNLINHQRYAECFAHDHYVLKKWGLHKIKFSLKSKRIEEHFIVDALEKLDPELGNDHLKTLIARDASRLDRLGEEKWKASIVRKCLTKGYSLDRSLKEVSAFLMRRVE